MPQYLTTRQAAAYLHVGTTSIKRWCDDGQLECEKTAGGHRRFSVATLDRFQRKGLPGDSFLASVPYMKRSEIDALDFGVIQLDDDGVVLVYNSWESGFTGFSVETVEGKFFFRKVAPCTNNDLVYGAFRRGVDEGVLDTELDYTFTYRMEPRNVHLHLYRHPETRTNWIFVRKI